MMGTQNSSLLKKIKGFGKTESLTYMRVHPRCYHAMRLDKYMMTWIHVRDERQIHVCHSCIRLNGFPVLKILCSTHSSSPSRPESYYNKDAVIGTAWCWEQKSWADHQKETEYFEIGPYTYESMCTMMAEKSGKKERLFNKWPVPLS